MYTSDNRPTFGPPPPPSPPTTTLSAQKQSRIVALIAGAGSLCHAYSHAHAATTLRELMIPLLPASPPAGSHREEFQNLLQQSIARDAQLADQVVDHMPGMPGAASWKEWTGDALTEAVVLLEGVGGWSAEVDGLKRVRDAL